MKITGEKVFSVPENNFSISASAEGYTLNYSNNAQDWTEWSEACPADETTVVTGAPKWLYYKLVGNNSEVEIKW